MQYDAKPAPATSRQDLRKNTRRSVIGGKSATRFMVAALGLLLGANALMADIIGDPVVARPDFDGGTGQLFIFDGSFSTPGETVTSWSFYSDQNASNDCSTGNASYVCSPGTTITPVLLEYVSPGDYLITGIGTTRTNNLDGVQTYDFGLVSGSSVVGPGFTYGFKSGGPLDTGDSDFGVVDFDSIGSPDFVSVGERTQLILGDSYTGTDVDRAYSIEFTSAPEPSAWILLSLGLSGLTLGKFWQKSRAPDRSTGCR